jgi:uncharacterized protein YbjT (DUF2867 family)
MFVVFGASGNTGKIVASTLLAQKHAVRVVLHGEAGGSEWRDKGAEVVVADVDDRAALERALRGASGTCVLLPPAFHSTQVRTDNDRRAKNLAAAIRAAGVGHAVLLSSIGAQHADGTGPVLSLHDAESTLADRPVPMVAARDIGLAAARLLVEGGSGKRVIQLAGPRDVSPHEVAVAFGRVLGKPVVAQQQPEEAMSAALGAAGMNAEWARLFQELTHGINTGRVAWEEGHPVWHGKTDLDVAVALRGLDGLVDGAHFFESFAEGAIFESLYELPGWPRTIRGRPALLDALSGYGNNIRLESSDKLVIHRARDARVVILEYEVHGKVVATGASYDNRFISVITLENRKIVHWRDYMDSLSAWMALNGTAP